MADPRQPRTVEMADIEALLREVPAGGLALDAPPPDLWDAIVAEVAAEVPARTAEVVPIRRWTGPSLLIAAVAAVVVLIAGFLGVTTLGDDDGAQLVASAELAHDPDAFDPIGADSSAHVRVLDDAGALRLEIDEADLPSELGEPADLEIWLLQPRADDLDIIPLGLVDADDPGTYEVPEGLELSTDTQVDISIEPRDGVATHSGRSILRAPLDFTA